MGLLETLVALIAAVAAALLVGRSQGRKAERAKAEAAYRETREKMDEVVVGDDPAVARGWLRERGR